MYQKKFNLINLNSPYDMSAMEYFLKGPQIFYFYDRKFEVEYIGREGNTANFRLEMENSCPAYIADQAVDVAIRLIRRHMDFIAEEAELVRQLLKVKKPLKKGEQI